MITIGIDPGMTGAIAEIYPTGAVILMDMPVIGKGIDEVELTKMLRPSVDYMKAYVFCELVHSMPKQGVASTFKFACAYQAVRQCLACYGYKREYVSPQVWKKEFGLLRKDKDEARRVAMELFPECCGALKRKKDINRADALLIAEYGRRVLARRG